MEEIRKDTEEIIAEAQSAEAAPVLELVSEEKPLPMKWHKFQKNFLLWAVALYMFVRVFLIVSGRIYYEAAIRDAIYAGMPLLRILDYAFAAFLVASGVCLIISACRLNKGSANLLVKVNLIMALGEIAYLMLRWAVTELPPLSLQNIALMIVHLLLWLVNRRYYRNRAYLPGKEEK